MKKLEPMQDNEGKCQENMREDAETQDRKRAYYLGMSYREFVKRKTELMEQAKSLKEMAAK